MKITTFLALFCLGLFFAYPLSAQEAFDTSKIENIPDYSSELSEKEFIENSVLHLEEPLNDKYLAYSVRLPEGWQKVEGRSKLVDVEKDEYTEYNASEPEVSQRLLGEISKFYGPGRIEQLSRFEVYAQALEFEITAKNWFLHEVLVRAYTLEGLKVISDRRVEALFVVVENDTAYIVRAVAEINGPRMVVAAYYVPEMFWMQERAQQQRAIESFTFVSPEVTQIETTRKHTFLDLLSFEYPASWRLIAPAIYSVDAMEARLLNTREDKTLTGEIRIGVISSELKNALVEEIKYQIEDLKKRGLKLDKLVATREDYPFQDHIYYGHVEQYKLTDEDNAFLGHEFWIGVLEEDRYFYLVTMLTPGRESEFYTWARNEEAYKTILESFKL